MKFLWYLPLLVLSWGTASAAENDRQAASQAEIRQ